MDIETPTNITDHENVSPQLAAARIGIQQLTMGEIEQAEELAGCGFTALSDSSRPQSKLLTALAVMLQRRTDRTFTFQQGQALTLEKFNELMSPAETDPKE